MPAVEHVVQIDGADDDIMSLAEVEGTGLSSFRFAETWQAVGPDDLATIIYTSGTTGPPKGVELTHANAMAECVSSAERFPLAPGGRAMSYLPSAHVVDRWSSHWWASITHGFSITSVGDMRTVIFLLPSVRPTRWGAVPRIWEKLHQALVGQGITDPEKLGEDERADLRARLGLDAAEHLGGGAAPMPIDVLRYFEALGLPISEAWGMSETAGAATGNPPEGIRLGTCGTPMPGVEIDLAADGELLVRGPMVMRGYRDNPGATAEAFVADGWLRTGDIAHVADRYVSIVDRKKELIVTAGGKNISPANVESRIEAGSLLIAHAAAVGDRRPYVAALIALDPDAAVEFATEHGIDDASVTALSTHPEVRAAGPRRGRGRQRRPVARRAGQALRDPAARVAAGRGGADADAEAQAARDRDALRGRDRRALLVGVRDPLARPRAGQVVPALRAVAVDRGARGLEGDALDGRGGEHLRPGRLLRRRLRRLAVVDLGPDVVEDLLAEQAADDAENQAERLVEELHRCGGYPLSRRWVTMRSRRSR